MTESLYDSIDDYYTKFVHKELQNVHSHFSLRTNDILRILGDVDGKEVCDLACGEGYLSRIIAQRGGNVTAVDISSKLLQQARKRSKDFTIKFLLDDAQTLSKIADESFDVAICNMALMDIPDILPIFHTVSRVLKIKGRFIIALLHPCFESPFTVPETIAEADKAGNYVACRVLHYNQEGLWHSGGQGIRGKVGAYHRKISTYFNGLIQAGFMFEEISEPTLPETIKATSFDAQWIQKIPRTLIISCAKS
ncbi:class I SAM-dependent methyltransferase [Candidatus Leptofilum sp.]|uniref:class I SAM-dependent methyltransferase n=1 Tax=Candidatus Leptofilum sp. TaxID=3241576 RepID=UPI003B5B49BD